MAKASGTEVATAGAAKNQLPAEFGLDESELEGIADLGYSEDANDSLVPILAILQDMSGEVKKGHSKKMDGAEVGMGILRSMKKLLPLDTTPITIIPVGFQHLWVQWRGDPGEGKIIRQYPFDDQPKEAREVPDPQNPDKTIWQMSGGDRLVDTRYHYVIANIDDTWMPIVIPMGGTNHTVSRTWTGQMKAVKLPSGQKAPAWFRQYSLGTKFTQAGAQSWYVYDINDLGWVTDRELRELGKQLNKGVVENVIAPDMKGEGVAEEEEVDNNTV